MGFDEMYETLRTLIGERVRVVTLTGAGSEVAT